MQWQTEDGIETDRDQCTWQPHSSVQGDKSLVKPIAIALLESDITIEEAGKTYNETISDQRQPDRKQPDKCQPDGSKYYLQYKKKTRARGRAKAAGWVDMELPPCAKSSWWRLDGYTIYEDENSSNDSDNDDDAGAEGGNGDGDNNGDGDEDGAMELSDFTSSDSDSTERVA